MSIKSANTSVSVEPFRGVEGTSDMALKTDDNLLPKHQQKLPEKAPDSLRQGQFTCSSSVFFAMVTIPLRRPLS